ncbi:MAG: ribosome maturation factor RimP [Chitinivibrionales bacterium]
MEKKVREIEPVIQEKVASLGYELVDIKYIRAGSKSILRVFVDGDNGITADDCEAVSKEISLLLDVENFSSSGYTLEVSSPGIDRPFSTDRDYERAAARELPVSVVLNKDVTGKKRYKGVIKDVKSKSILLRLNNSEEDVELLRENIKTCKQVLDF